MKSEIFETYDEKINIPEIWISKADELVYSADILAQFEMLKLRTRRDVSGVTIDDFSICVMPQVLMLYGYAIENYLKAILVKKGKIKIVNDKVVGIGHDLMKLFLDCDFKFADSFEEIIKKIERHIYWEGRYPGPLKKKFYPDEFTEDNISEWPNTYVTNLDLDIIKSLFFQIEKMLDDNFE